MPRLRRRPATASRTRPGVVADHRSAPVAVRPLTRRDGRWLLGLVDALADFEKLARPTSAGRKRLLADAFGRRRRFEAFLAWSGKRAVGYAIFFETYSSFRAQPTLYLEDLFVLPDLRRAGIGLALFTAVLREADRRSCGRMEWQVLDWNVNAIRFYNRIGARQLKGWLPFRIDREKFRKILRSTR